MYCESMLQVLASDIQYVSLCHCVGMGIRILQSAYGKDRNAL